jgi:tetratricopeptide (TPR) repeat protein
VAERPGRRGRPPQVPATPREPIGIDRAGAGRGRPPRRQADGKDQAPERPELPAGLTPELPGKVRKEIDRLVSPAGRARDVKLSLWLGSEASDDGDTVAALRFLRWAKHLAPRLAVVRETLGIALYRAGDLKAALAELQAYRRLAGLDDQNHLIADCMRASGRELDRAVEIAMLLVEDDRSDVERRVEAAIVAAALHEDLEHRPRGRALVDRVLKAAWTSSEPESRVRLHWIASELAERDGDRSAAAEHMVALLALDGDYPDAPERLEALRG